MIEITLPLKLVSEANNRDHWRTKHKRNKKIASMLMAYWPKEEIALPCKITIIRVGPRRLDWDNNISASKFLIDEISNKLLPGLARGRADGDDRLTWSCKQQRGGPREYSVIINIEPLDEGLS